MSKGYLALEITPHRIRYIHLQRTFRGYQVMKSGNFVHMLNTMGQGELTRAIKELLTREKISPQRLFVTVFRQGNLIRQMTMPSMKGPELEEAITSEIERLPVFANNPYDFIYSSARTLKDKLNVVFAAVDQGILKYIIEECRKLRIPFEHLEISPLNLKEILPLSKSDNQAVLIVHEQMSYLAIMRKGEYSSFYQTATGSKYLYPGHNGKVEESILSGYVLELQRVIKSYVSDHKHESIQKLWVVWDSKEAPDLLELIKGKLGIDCTAFNLTSIAQFKVVPNEEALNPIHVLFATPLVISLKKIKPQFSLNHFFRAMNIKRYALRCAVMASLFVGFFVSVFGYKSWEYHQMTDRLSQQIQGLSDEREQLILSTQDLYRQRDEYLRVRQGLLDQATFVKNLNRISWSEVLSIVAEEMPEDLALSSFRFNETGSVAFFGDALDVEVIAELIRRIDTSAILNDGKFDFLTEKIIEEQRIYSFGILAQLQSKISDDEILKEEAGAHDKAMVPAGPSAKVDLVSVSASNGQGHEKRND